MQWLNPGADESQAEYELYDYEEDPHETRNLAAKHPEVVNELKAKLDQYPEPVKRNRPKKRK